MTLINHIRLAESLREGLRRYDEAIEQDIRRMFAELVAAGHSEADADAQVDALLCAALDGAEATR